MYHHFTNVNGIFNYHNRMWTMEPVNMVDNEQEMDSQLVQYNHTRHEREG